jgi:hypothetical protein
MLVERLRDAWLERERAVPIDSALSFTPEGLVMGAGTVLIPADGERCLQNLEGRDARTLALLSVAYGREMTPSVGDKIDRAAKCWARGEDCLALIHLALAGLHRVEDRRETARRLFMADGLMKAGVRPQTIIQALDLGIPEEGFQRYMDTQARVPKGSGAVSGRWTKINGTLARLSIAAAEFLGNIAVGGMRVAAAHPVSFTLGLILIPRSSDLRVAGDVPELQGLRYAWNRDEAILHLTYDGQNGTRKIEAMLDADGQFLDGGRVVARLLPDETLVIDPGEISSDLADKDGPNLCPTPGPDKPGRSGPGGEKDKDYEDQIKLLVNPDNPTPRGYGYQFFNPVTGQWVFIDDCQHRTRTRVEIKSEYERLLSFPSIRTSVTDQWLDQSARQLKVSKGFGVTSVFAEKSSAEIAKNLFAAAKDGRERINVWDEARVGAMK